jgi:hypothetical protein
MVTATCVTPHARIPRETLVLSPGTVIASAVFTLSFHANELESGYTPGIHAVHCNVLTTSAGDKPMKTEMGVWVDHRRAVVVRMKSSGEEVITVDSEAEKQLRRAGDRTEGTFERQAVPPDDTQERKFHASLNIFYDEIISHLKHATAILILGPGEASTELRKRIECTASLRVPLQLQKTDRLTDPQIVAAVQSHFQNG